MDGTISHLRSGFQRARQNMQAMQRRRLQIGEARGIANRVNGGEVEVGGEDDGPVCLYSSWRGLRHPRADGQYRAGRLAQHRFRGRAEHQALKSVQRIGPQNRKIDSFGLR